MQNPALLGAAFDLAVDQDHKRPPQADVCYDGNVVVFEHVIILPVHTLLARKQNGKLYQDLWMSYSVSQNAREQTCTYAWLYEHVTN